MADLEFKVAKRRKQVITFTLEGDDHQYEFKAPKQALIFMPFLAGGDDSNEISMLKSVFDWLGAGLPDEDVERILGRLRDPEDDLDFDTLNEVITSLTEKIGARPTT